METSRIFRFKTKCLTGLPSISNLRETGSTRQCITKDSTICSTSTTLWLRSSVGASYGATLFHKTWSTGSNSRQHFLPLSPTTSTAAGQDPLRSSPMANL
uniref:Uncharacterized protein n=1 Tax=Brassica oleracea TaxID=3712 RepID=A0A3P6APD8_BRAOL|nr:unnamed protein product [Brassica oleracea]